MPAPDVFFAIADPTRRRLLDLLGARPGLPVHELAVPFLMTRPAVSQHLRILRDAGLVVEHRVGRERRYQLHAAPLHEVSEWVNQYERFWREHLAKLGAYLDEHAAADDHVGDKVHAAADDHAGDKVHAAEDHS